MKQFTIFEGPERGQWEVTNPDGHFIISEWVSKQEAIKIAARENKQAADYANPTLVEFETVNGQFIYRKLLKEFWYGDYHCATINYKGKRIDVTLGEKLED